MGPKTCPQLNPTLYNCQTTMNSEPSSEPQEKEAKEGTCLKKSKPPIGGVSKRGSSEGLPKINTKLTAMSVPNMASFAPSSSTDISMNPELDKRPSSAKTRRPSSYGGLFGRRMSVDRLHSKKGLNRVLYQIKSEEEIGSADIEFERRLNESVATPSNTEDMQIVSPSYTSAPPSKLNPEHEVIYKSDANSSF